MRRFGRVRSLLPMMWQSFRADLGIGTPSPDSDFWYHRPGFRTAAGTYVSPETAMRLAAVYACVRVISETIASLPLIIYRRLPDGGKERSDDHPLHEVLQKPNVWQTSFEFWEMLQAHLELRGNAFAEIIPGNSSSRGRAIDQLIPLHPDRVRVYRLADGRLRYEVTNYFDGATHSVPQEYMLHLRGMSMDGIMGISTITAASEVVGVGLAQQEYGSRFFANKATPSLAIKTVKLDDAARDKLQQTISEGFSGANAFKAMVLPPGMEVQVLGLTNKDSQLIEARQSTRTDIASMFRLPPHKIGDLTRGTFSNIEQQNIEFATDSIRPRLVRIERRLDIDFLDPIGEALGAAPAEYFAAFDMDALMRGDLKSTYEAYAQALPWMPRNEIRVAAGKNRLDDPAYDECLVPVNMETVTQAELRSQNAAAVADANVKAALAPPPPPAPPKTPDTSGDPGESIDVTENAALREAHIRALAASAAGRLVRREAKALRNFAKHDAAQFEQEVRAFYDAQVFLIGDALVIPQEAAQKYARQHCLLLSAARPEQREFLISKIEEESAGELADLALGRRSSRDRKSESRNQELFT